MLAKQLDTKMIVCLFVHEINKPAFYLLRTLNLPAFFAAFTAMMLASALIFSIWSLGPIKPRVEITACTPSRRESHSVRNTSPVPNTQRFKTKRLYIPTRITSQRRCTVKKNSHLAQANVLVQYSNVMCYTQQGFTQDADNIHPQVFT